MNYIALLKGGEMLKCTALLCNVFSGTDDARDGSIATSGTTPTTKGCPSSLTTKAILTVRSFS